MATKIERRNLFHRSVCQLLSQNIQFAVKDEVVYVIEANPHTNRTKPPQGLP